MLLKHKINSGIRTTALALPVLFVTACAIGPDYQVPMVNIASSYLYAPEDINPEQGAQQTVSAVQWWHRFNDPVLNQLVADAQQQNIPLKVAAQRIKMAESYHTIVASFKVPSVSLGAGSYHYQVSENDPMLAGAVTPINVPQPAQPLLGESVTLMDKQNNGLYVGASIAWQLDLFGRLDNLSQAANIRVEQAAVYQRGLTLLISSDVIHNYLQLRGAQQRKVIAQTNLSDQQQMVAIMQGLVNSGYGSDMALAQAQARLSLTASVLPQLGVAEQVHRQRLAILLGETIASVDLRLGETGKLPQLTGTIPLGLPSDLLKRRSDIALAEREMAAINKTLAASMAAKYPSFFLTGTPGIVAGNFDDLFSHNSISWLGSAGMSWNVFDGGRSDAKITLEQARFDSAVLNYQHTVNNAFSEVDTLLFSYGKSQEHQAHVTKAVRQVELALSKAKSLHRAGLLEKLQVLKAQSQVNSIKDLQISSRLQTAQVSVGIHKALGGNWEILPVPED